MATVKKKTTRKKATVKKATRKPVKRKITAKPASKTKKPTKRKRVAKKPQGTCFVLTPFREPFNGYYATIIEPAITSAKLEPKRGDSIFRPSPIMADVWQMIREAKVLIGVLTGKNPNVFYELGLAHAIGKPVILVSETLDDVPFDLQALRILLYNKDDPNWGLKLRKSIMAALGETMAEPVQAVPSMFRKKVKSQAPEESELAARVGAIERKLASLPPLRSRLQGRLQESAETLHLDTQLRHAVDRADSVRIAMEASARGLSYETINQALKNAAGPSEAETVMDLLLDTLF